MASFVTLKQLSCFHHVDIEVYARLVFDLGLNPELSKKIVAFWYWLERKGYKDFINNMLLLSDAELNGLALEAITCLDCLYNDGYITISSFDIDRFIPLPIMCKLVTQDFSLGKLYADRTNGILSIQRFLKDVCDKVFIDIKPRNSVNGFQIIHALANGFQFQHGFQIPPVMTNGIQVQPMVTNGVDQVQSVISHTKEFQECELPHQNNEMVADQEDSATQDSSGGLNINDRTLFVTFSKGHPISKEELKDLIVRSYGNCVQAIQMRVEPEPLFARVVVNSVSAMAKILGDKDVVKLSINGKDVRLRLFVPNINQVSSSNAQQ